MRFSFLYTKRHTKQSLYQQHMSICTVYNNGHKIKEKTTQKVRKDRRKQRIRTHRSNSSFEYNVTMNRLYYLCIYSIIQSCMLTTIKD